MVWKEKPKDSDVSYIDLNFELFSIMHVLIWIQIQFQENGREENMADTNSKHDEIRY